MKLLTARDTLTDRLSRVSARAHPSQARHGAGIVYAVFDGAQDDPDGRFIGLVTPQDIAHFPDRIFADLVRGWTGLTVDADSELDEVDRCFTEHDLDALAITESGRFIGAITRESLFQALLDRERTLMQETRRLLMENRQLNRHLLNATEEERRYLARELHDEMGQCTTAIQAEAETIVALSGDLDPRIHQCASSISDLGAHLYNVVHAMLRRLRPELLDDLGLSEAIQHIVRTWQSQHPDIDCRLHLGRRLDEVNEAAAIVVYRVVQECLTNVSRHSWATAVTVRLAHRHNIDGSRFHVLVRDNGNGLAPKQEGLGLIGLRERVESLGGEFRIEWKAWGMRLLAQIPTN